MSFPDKNCLVASSVGGCSPAKGWTAALVSEIALSDVGGAFGPVELP